jgi:hypothetical protein
VLSAKLSIYVSSNSVNRFQYIIIVMIIICQVNSVTSVFPYLHYAQLVSVLFTVDFVYNVTDLHDRIQNSNTLKSLSISSHVGCPRRLFPSLIPDITLPFLSRPYGLLISKLTSHKHKLSVC